MALSVFVFIPGSPQEAVKVWIFFFFLVTLPSSSLSLGRGTLAHMLLSFHQTAPHGSHLGSAFSPSHLTCSFLPAPSADLCWAPRGRAPPACLRLLPLATSLLTPVATPQKVLEGQFTAGCSLKPSTAKTSCRSQEPDPLAIPLNWGS